ncbi:hypothetical protein [Nonomuraea basaltis]|uniref:hypothetical protein n=1 Tax=Nonomuraea basaltis TaxID=2495887 RepID=UPI00110C5637|nr:hypothetical protein [Nonomuraea basaltis]TMR97703.1 hypothetical protein EJK15_16830 [Nonomuraea basaltis]
MKLVSGEGTCAPTRKQSPAPMFPAWLALVGAVKLGSEAWDDPATSQWRTNEDPTVLAGNVVDHASES